MELNWSTFALEILNFLVLMYLLKRFFYQPVMNVIDQRQRRIKQQLSTAEQRERDARALEERYQHRLDEWEEEKQQAHQELMQDLRREREQTLEAIQQDIDKARQQAATLAERQQQDQIIQTQQTAYDQASYFAARLLSRLASPALEANIIELVQDDLRQLLPAQQQNLIKASENSTHPVEIITAFPLGTEQQRQLQIILGEHLATNPQVMFRQSSELMAGIRIGIGARRLEASLADELRYFSQHSHIMQREVPKRAQ